MEAQIPITLSDEVVLDDLGYVKPFAESLRTQGEPLEMREDQDLSLSELDDEPDEVREDQDLGINRPEGESASVEKQKFPLGKAALGGLALTSAGIAAGRAFVVHRHRLAAQRRNGWRPHHA
jgi:hypothetical protein